MQLSFQYKEDAVVLQVEPDADGGRVVLPDGTERRFSVRRLPGDVLELTLPEGSATRTFRAPVARTERGIEISFAGRAFVFAPTTGRPTRGKPGRASGALVAPMVGVVAEVLVAEGQQVQAYQPLAVIEAMKVMATLEAPFAGTVKTLHVRKGERIGHGAPVVDIEPSAPDPLSHGKGEGE